MRQAPAVRDLHDEDGLRDAYQAHGPELYRFARRALRDDDAARDAVQEIFLRGLALR